MPASLYSFRRTVCLVVLLVLAASVAYAEVVEHYGSLVEADGSVTDCGSCHDGAMAPNAHVCISNCSSDTPHPVLRRYPPPGKEHEFAPAVLLEQKGIKFVNNKLACISCHNIRNAEKFHIATDNGGRGLCSACHITK